MFQSAPPHGGRPADAEGNFVLDTVSIRAPARGGHPPDTVVAMALAYHAFKTGRQPGDLGFTL